MLGVKPYDEFKIQGLTGKYRINNNLILQQKGNRDWNKSIACNLILILNGIHQIITIPILPSTEKIAIDYAKGLWMQLVSKRLK